jgi:hypothetical protein
MTMEHPLHHRLSEQLVLESHVRLWLKTNASTEDVGKRCALLSESIDNRSSRRGEGGLEHIAQDAQHTVETSIVLSRRIIRASLPLNASHHLSDKNQINDQWRSEKRILADVEKTDGLMAAHEDLCVVLIESALVVSDSWHVLDDDAVIGMLALLVKNIVGRYHVIDDIRLGNLLGTELLLGAQVLPVVVAEMVVASNGSELDTSVDEEVHESRLHLGLTRFEVVTTNESIVLFCKLDGAWNKRVLWRAIDEGNLLENASNGKDCGRRDLLVAALDSLNKVVGSVINAVDEVGEALSIGSPLNNHLIEVVFGLEVTKQSVRLNTRK